MLDSLIQQTIAIGLGLLFIGAAVHKLLNLEAFRTVLRDYQILPPSLVPVVAMTIPLLELLLGAGWFVGNAVGTATAACSALLLGTYALAIAINLARGRIYIDCGCGFGGSADAEQMISAGLVVRNVVLLILALVALLPVNARTLTFGDFMTLVVAVISAVLLFAASNQLISNRAAINVWRKRRD